jgi:hypothetical protein
MRSIQEVFAGDFADATQAVVQKLYPEAFNLEALASNFTESWQPLAMPAEVFVLSLGDKNSRRRQILAGFIKDVQPSIIYKGRFRFYVDRFRHIGEHDLDVVSDGRFYSNGGGGGARNYVTNDLKKNRAGSAHQLLVLSNTVPEGAMERRLVWVRQNHHRFRDPVWRHWEGLCAVTDADCNGLLVASHIHSWAKSTPQEKTDWNNGLLLSAPMDALFDRGWIAFSDSGKMLMKPSMSAETRSIFGVSNGRMRIKRAEKVTARMREYLERHRKLNGFANEG